VQERIASLAIPPAWEEVWICPVANGHLQATGVDAAGRKQYLYHEAWRENRDPAVCRSSHIDPRVFDFFDSKATIRRGVRSAINEPQPDRFPDRERIERAVLKLLS
jgi:DNA topoisomerase I